MNFTNKKEVKTIDEVTEKIIDYRGKSPKKTLSGVRLITAKSVKNGRIENDYFEYIAEENYDAWMTRGLPKKDDILFTTEAPLGEVAQLTTDQRIALAQRIVILRGKPNQIDQKYYLYALQSRFVQNQLQNQATGGTAKGISQKRLRKINLITFSLKEQEKIAEILSSCDRAIELTEKLIASKRKLKRGLMQKLLTGKLRFPKFKGQKWDTKKIGDIANVKMGHSPPSSSYNKTKEGIPLVQGMSNVKNGLANPKAWTKVITQLANPESILLSVRAPVGAITKTNIEVCVGRGFAILEAKPNQISKDFLFYLLEFNKKKWKKFSQGSTFESITSSEVKKFSIILPNEIREQEAITQVISLIDQEIEKLGLQKHNFQQTKKGLMQQLLTGKTRVPLNQ